VVVAPEIGSFVFGTQLVMWVALGGRGTLIGPVLGTIAIDLISAYLSGNLPYVWNLIIGSIFVAVIVALPQGIVPVLKTGLRRLRSAATGRDAASYVRVPALIEAPQGGASTGSDAPALNVTDLACSYGSLKVLEGVAFKAFGSELLGIIGPNGAGKTTLMRCLSNGYERTDGTLAVFGRPIARNPPQSVVGFGIGRSFQTTSLFETLMVSECLRLARYRLDGTRMLSHAATLPLPDSARRVIAATGLDRQLVVECRHLSHGLKRALELAMVLALEPSVLLLDEPTAGLTKPERTLIGSILVDLVQREGLCTLIIEHDLDFVREISTRIIVLHQGKVLLDGSVAEVVGSELVRSIYAGAAPHQERA
jgi:branched-chain amino acid transport system permease protein